MQDEGAAQKLIGKNVKRLRRVRGLTQEDFAHESGLSLTFLKDIEAGRGNPTVSTLAVICRALSVHLSELTWSPGRKPLVVDQLLEGVAEQVDALRKEIRRLRRIDL